MKKIQDRVKWFEDSYIPVTESGCWLWNRYVGKNGYATVRVNGQDIGAHRYSWELHYGSIPNGMEVCHKCDVGCCVNPNHLFLGTHKDNMLDMTRKGRNRQVKLMRDSVVRIRETYKLGLLTQEELAKAFEMHVSSINAIVNGNTWK